MRVQRLTWAGIRVENGDATVFVDAIEDVGGWVDHDVESLQAQVVPLAAGTDHRAALITHIHGDHFDPPALTKVLGRNGFVLCPDRVVDEARMLHPATRPARMFEPVSVPKRSGDLVVRSVPASDGLGDYQVSWIVDGGGRRIIHCGDTLWHGEWWKIARQHGPFDVAFLPINGVRIRRPGVRDAGIPASMSPEQAAAAAYALGAALACPIHYGLFGNDTNYIEHPDAEATFLEAAEQLGVEARVLPPGAWLDLSS